MDVRDWAMGVSQHCVIESKEKDVYPMAKTGGSDNQEYACVTNKQTNQPTQQDKNQETRKRITRYPSVVQSFMSQEEGPTRTELWLSRQK